MKYFGVLLCILFFACKESKEGRNDALAALVGLGQSPSFEYCSFLSSRYACTTVVVNEPTAIVRIVLEKSGTELDSIETNGILSFPSGCRDRMYLDFPDVPSGALRASILRAEGSICGVEITADATSLDRSVPEVQGGPDWQDLTEIRSGDYILKFER